MFRGRKNRGGAMLNRTVAVLAGTFSLLACGVGSDAVGDDSEGVAAQELKGETFTLWIHGRTPSTTTKIGDYTDFSYWGSSRVSAGVNKKAVNWDGHTRISEQNQYIRNALDCFCTGDNWCHIGSHSAGDLQVGYALALFGGTDRPTKKPEPNANGVCPDLDGSKQKGWNIVQVAAAASAAGGSELARLANQSNEPLVVDLSPTSARTLYDHNLTHGVPFKMFAGAKGRLHSGLLPGQDDEAVAYHSAGGVSGTSGSSYCNPGDWFCKDLTLGKDPVEGGVAKWNNHDLLFRDDKEDYDHLTRGDWTGITGKAREHLEKTAVK
jgi:hypothetical protein